jgi:hypothetical protein
MLSRVQRRQQHTLLRLAHEVCHVADAALRLRPFLAGSTTEPHLMVANVSEEHPPPFQKELLQHPGRGGHARTSPLEPQGASDVPKATCEMRGSVGTRPAMGQGQCSAFSTTESTAGS